MVGLVNPPRTPRKDCINKPPGRRGHFGAQPCLAVALITSTLLLRPRVHKRASSTHRGCHWEGFTIATDEVCCKSVCACCLLQCQLGRISKHQVQGGYLSGLINQRLGGVCDRRSLKGSGLLIQLERGRIIWQSKECTKTC